MRLAGRIGKGRRHHHQRAIAHGAVKLGETQVIADRQTNPAERRIEGRYLHAVLNGARLVVTFFAPGKAEQMDLVVAGHRLALRIVDQRGVQDLAGIVAGQRQRAADQPDPIIPGNGRHAVLNLAAFFFGPGQLVGVLHPHDRPVFRQQRQLRALFGRLPHQPFGGCEVLRRPRRRHHLNCGDLEWRARA